jgi:hypothetical protein
LIDELAGAWKRAGFFFLRAFHSDGGWERMMKDGAYDRIGEIWKGIWERTGKKIGKWKNWDGWFRFLDRYIWERRRGRYNTRDRERRKEY